MAGIKPIVYDFLNLGSATLQQLSINAVTVQLWRWKIDEHRTNGTVKDLDASNYWDIPLKKFMPSIPPAIYHLIKERVRQFGLSLIRWLYECFFSHSSFQIFHANSNDILNIFDDFACDNNGAIHNVRTAKRMMLCDRISQQEKFQFACEYCFEDDVRRIWPSVSGQLDLSKFSLENRPLEYYWICRISNEMSRTSKLQNFERRVFDESAADDDDEDGETIMLEFCPPHAWSSFQYFWHKLTWESQWRVASKMFRGRKLDFAKFILPMLNEELLNWFVAEKGTDWICDLFKSEKEEYYILSQYGDDEKRSWIFAAWTYLCSRNKIDERNCVEIMKNILYIETHEHIINDAFVVKDAIKDTDTPKFDYELKTLCFCDMWSSVPRKLKLSATKRIIREIRLSKRGEWGPSEARESRFLMKMLSDATSGTKKAFWVINWYYLTTSTRLQDLQLIMELCFKNENEIDLFKRNVLSKSKNIADYCHTLFIKCYFEKLDPFLTFCYPEPQNRKLLKQQLLQSNICGKYCFYSNFDCLKHRDAIDKFITDACDSVNLAIEFKSQFTLLPEVQSALMAYVEIGLFSSVIVFVDTFALVDEIAMNLKRDFVKDLKSRLVDGTQQVHDAKELQDFLVWCLGDADEVIKFKQSISPVKIVHNTVENKNGGFNKSYYLCSFDVFLKWYFNTTDEIEQFKNEYSEVIEKSKRRRLG